MQTVDAYCGALLRLPVKDVDMPLLRERLTVFSPDGEELPLFREDRDNVWVPRNFQVESVLLPQRRLRVTGPSRVEDRRRRRIPKGKWSITTQPRDETQRTALQRLLETSGTDRVLALGCGKGKTYLALAYACADPLRYPCLIVVPTTQLQEQWKREILSHTSLSSADISFVGGAGGRVPGPFITVGVLNSVSSPKFLEDFGDFFKLVVFDEAHRLGASLLGRAAAHFTGERLSLTATFIRDDGMHTLYEHHLGPTAYEDVSSDLDPTVYFVRTGVRINEQGYRWKGGPVQIPKLFNSLAKNVKRNAVALELIQAATKKNRTILVLGDRVRQLDHLTSLLIKSGVDAELLVGRMKGESKQDYRTRLDYSLTKARVALATSLLAKEGLDRAMFDTLLVLFPFRGEGRLRQSVGRILRPHLKKRDPLVMILQDSSYALERSSLTGRMQESEGVLTSMTRAMYENALRLGYSVEVVDA